MSETKRVLIALAVGVIVSLGVLVIKHFGPSPIVTIDLPRTERVCVATIVISAGPVVHQSVNCEIHGWD